MQAVQIHGTKKQIQRLVKLSKEALREGAYRVAGRLHAVALNMEGVLEGHRSGRPTAITDAQREKLTDILDSGPVAYGFSTGVWTSPMVARVIEDEFYVKYHPAHVSRILHELGFSVQRPKKKLAKADEALQSRWGPIQIPEP